MVFGQHTDQDASEIEIGDTLLKVLPIVITDMTTGNILYANGRAEDLLGYSSNELDDKSVDVLVPDKYLPEHQEHRREYAYEPMVREIGTKQLEAKRKDGTVFPCFIALYPRLIARRRCIMAILIDINPKEQTS